MRSSLSRGSLNQGSTVQDIIEHLGKNSTNPIFGGVLVFKSVMACIWFTGGTSPDTENDFLLAQMIQLEYDKEYDRTIDSMEKRYNGESKGIYTCQFVSGVSMHAHVYVAVNFWSQLILQFN